MDFSTNSTYLIMIFTAKCLFFGILTGFYSKILIYQSFYFYKHLFLPKSNDFTYITGFLNNPILKNKNDFKKNAHLKKKRVILTREIAII